MYNQKPQIETFLNDERRKTALLQVVPIICPCVK